MAGPPMSMFSIAVSGAPTVMIFVAIASSISSSTVSRSGSGRSETLRWYSQNSSKP